jgi:hypothetical protein
MRAGPSSWSIRKITGLPRSTRLAIHELRSEVAKSCVYLAEAEIPKEHPRAIDKDNQVHDFQITCSTRFSERGLY